MNQLLLFSLPVLLFCAVAHGLWCVDRCISDRPCVPIYCYTCGEEQCYKKTLIRVTDEKKDELEEHFQGFQRPHSIWKRHGCTTPQNRHICGTIQTASLDYGDTFQLTFNVTCCNTFGCNK